MTTIVDQRPVTFAALLRRLRLERGLSQWTLCERAGIDRSFCNRLESGERKPRPETVQALVEALGVGDDDADRLFAAAGYWPPAWQAEDVIGLLAWRGHIGYRR